LCLFTGVAILGHLARLRGSMSAPVSTPSSDDPAPSVPSAVTTRYVRPLGDNPGRQNQLSVRVGRRTILVPLDQIEHVEAADDYVYRLAELSARLDGDRFVRIHRSHIVNLSFVESVERTGDNRYVVLLKNGDRLRASRQGSVILRQRLRT
jgi:DNA-binding LytR/AlgR family response regulator